MNATATLEARVDVLALALQCIAASLESEQAREVAAAIKDGLVQMLAERGEMSAAHFSLYRAYMVFHMR